MGSVFSRILSPTHRKVIILGPNSVGKTSIFTILSSFNTVKKTESWINFFNLTKREVKNDRLLEIDDNDSDNEQFDILDRRPFKPVPSTISFNHCKLNFEEKFFSLWELSNVIREHWKCYFHQMEGLILVFDSNHLKYQRYTEALDFIRNIYHQLLKHDKSNTNGTKIILPTLIFLNKIDKTSSRQLEDDLSTKLQLHNFFTNYKIQESSILERYTILEGFSWLAKQIVPTTVSQTRESTG